MGETIKLTTGDMEDIINIINTKKQAKESTVLDKELPQKVKYRIARVLDKIERELKIYLKEKESEAIKFAVKIDEKPQMTSQGNLQIDPKHQYELNEKIQEMREEVIDLGIEPIKFNLEGEEANDLSIEDIMLLIKMEVIME